MAVSSLSRGDPLLLLVDAADAGTALDGVLERIPWSRLPGATEVLAITDDGHRGIVCERRDAPVPVNVWRTRGGGRGTKLKLGYQFAIERQLVYVAAIADDGRIDPEVLPELLAPVLSGEADAVLGSRSRVGVVRNLGGRVLTLLQQRMLGTRFSGLQDGCQVITVDALEQIPFTANTDGRHFETQVALQLLRRGLRVVERRVPVSRTDPARAEMAHLWNVVEATFKSACQDAGVFYQPYLDVNPERERYALKLGFNSPHRFVLDTIAPGSRVLDIGCGSAGLGAELRRRRSCHVTGLDRADRVPSAGALDCTLAHDLDAAELPADLGDDFDYVLLLDVLEHLERPDLLLTNLRRHLGHRQPRVLASTGNVAFLPLRLGLLSGQFNYGPRGILDLTHTRLFTFDSFRQLFAHAGVQIDRWHGIPAPFPLALDGRPARWLLGMNEAAIRMSDELFAYQVMVEAVIPPTVEAVLAGGGRAGYCT